MSERFIKEAQAFAIDAENFRTRWKPTGIEAAYHERDFNTQFNCLMARAMALGGLPALEALGKAAEAGFSRTPWPPVVINGGKP